MAYSYDITTDGGKVRQLAGDTIETYGVLPKFSRDQPASTTNFTDAEIAAFLDMEGGHVQRAAALALENAATRWSVLAGTYRLGPESESHKQYQALGERAQRLRDKYGYEDSSATSGFSVQLDNKVADA